MAREQRGFTQATLAERVGVTRSAVAQWETGRSGQVGGNLARVADALDVGVEHLLLGAAPARVVQELGLGDSVRGDELALMRFYRALDADDRSIVLRMMKRLAKKQDGHVVEPRPDVLAGEIE